MRILRQYSGLRTQCAGTQAIPIDFIDSELLVQVGRVLLVEITWGGIQRLYVYRNLSDTVMISPAHKTDLILVDKDRIVMAATPTPLTESGYYTVCVTDALTMREDGMEELCKAMEKDMVTSAYGEFCARFVDWMAHRRGGSSLSIFDEYRDTLPKEG